IWPTIPIQRIVCKKFIAHFLDSNSPRKAFPVDGGPMRTNIAVKRRVQKVPWRINPFEIAITDSDSHFAPKVI
ncbi:MAG TPA: hypothetical protein PLQ00_15925, partial [Thermoguttaceae bacterium]|nr:hypothetical protein [Thermoguttaceae bacterium]